MSVIDLIAPAPFTALKASIGEVSFETLKGFRRSADMEIVKHLNGLVTSQDARDAAASAARDCGVLAEDVSLAGASPSEAWREIITDDRDRALLSLDRLVATLPGCSNNDERGGVLSRRSGSVPMKRKTAYALRRS
jgi:hypothetical protein